MFFLLVVCIVLLGSFPPFIIDHFGYFVPTIKWISEFGMTRGLSNLDLILGQTSFWHIFQAGFSHIVDDGLRINAFLALVYLIYIYEKKCWFHLITFPLLLFFVQSPTPDLPVLIFALIILQEMFSGSNHYSFIVWLSTFAFIIKPTAVWLPLAAVLYGILYRRNKVSWLPAVLVIILFGFKNIWTFGYPIFPVTFPDFGIWWKPHHDILDSSSQMAIMKTFDEQYSFTEIQKFNVAEAVFNWLTLPGLKGKINILLIISLIWMVLLAIVRKSTTVWIIVSAVIIKSVIVLLFSAQYRFFLDVFFVLAFLILRERVTYKPAVTAFLLFSSITGILFFTPNLLKNLVPSFRVGQYIGTPFTTIQLLEPAVYHYNKSEQFQIGNLTFNVNTGYPFSYNTPPAAISPGFLLDYYNAGIFPQKITGSVHGGYFWKQMNPHEKQVLSSILKKLKLK